MRLPSNLDVQPEVADYGQALIEEWTAKPARSSSVGARSTLRHISRTRVPGLT